MRVVVDTVGEQAQEVELGKDKGQSETGSVDCDTRHPLWYSFGANKYVCRYFYPLGFLLTKDITSF